MIEFETSILAIKCPKYRVLPPSFPAKVELEIFIPPSVRTSASANLAQHTPIAPAAICFFAQYELL